MADIIDCAAHRIMECINGLVVVSVGRQKQQLSANCLHSLVRCGAFMDGKITQNDDVPRQQSWNEV